MKHDLPTPTDYEIDTHIGQRIRERRLVMGVTQTQLADAIGVAFQQVQKYETGKNRVSGSKLFRIAEILQVHIGYFWDGLPAQHALDAGADKLAPRTGREADMLRAYRACHGATQVAILTIAQQARGAA